MKPTTLLLTLTLLFAPVGVTAQESFLEPDTAGNSQALKSAPFTNFCLERLFERRGGKLYCNWIRNFTAACEITSPSNRAIEEGAVIEGPVPVGNCSNGDTVLRLVHY